MGLSILFPNDPSVELKGNLARLADIAREIVDAGHDVASVLGSATIEYGEDERSVKIVYPFTNPGGSVEVTLLTLGDERGEEGRYYVLYDADSWIIVEASANMVDVLRQQNMDEVPASIMGHIIVSGKAGV